jgi:flagellar hook-associated protein 2
MLSSIAGNLGFGSGIDTAKVVADLAAASRAPKAERFAALAKSNEAKISALAQARSDLDGFADSLAELTNGGTLRSQPTSSNEALVTARATAGAPSSAAASEIVVSSLARAQTVHSAPIADAAAPIGRGRLTLSVGGTAFAITIDAANDSASGLAAAINASGSGVQARLINDAGNTRLILKGASGAANAFTLSADTGAEPQLQQFASSLTLAQSAGDAQFTVDGVAFNRASNVIDDILPGISFTLQSADPLKPVTLSITPPTDTLRQTVGDFVSVFNTLRSGLIAARQAGNSSAGLRAFERQLGDLLTQRLTSDAGLSSLSDIGLSTNRDGSIALDRARLDAALRDRPAAVEALFNPPRDALRTEATDPGIAIALDRLRDSATGGSGVLGQLSATLKREADSIAKNRERMEEREALYKARLEKQFAAMESQIGALKATQSYLDQQIKLWTGSND